MDDARRIFNRIAERAPLVHFITNYVTANDCAAMTLACGASPIMADEEEEIMQLVAQAAAVVINIGTVNRRTLPAMLMAGREANRLNIPVVLDPVAVGSTDFRAEAIKQLLNEIRFTVIKGNSSEIRFLARGEHAAKGADASQNDWVTETNLLDSICVAKEAHNKTGSVILVSGPIDVVYGRQCGYIVRNGHPFMTAVTGTGCMLGAVVGCVLGANPDTPTEAAATAAVAMGICGKNAHERLAQMEGGAGLYRALLFDGMSNLNGRLLQQQMLIERI